MLMMKRSKKHTENERLYIIRTVILEHRKRKRKNTKENSKKLVKLMESYQIRKSGQDMITDTI